MHVNIDARWSSRHQEPATCGTFASAPTSPTPLARLSSLDSVSQFINEFFNEATRRRPTTLLLLLLLLARMRSSGSGNVHCTQNKKKVQKKKNENFVRLLFIVVVAGVVVAVFLRRRLRTGWSLALPQLWLDSGVGRQAGGGGGGGA